MQSFAFEKPLPLERTTPGGTTEESVISARREAAQKLALYGSIDKWPTLALESKRYAMCVCGHSRTKSHRMVSTDRGPCTAKHCNCNQFVAVRKAAAP